MKGKYIFTSFLMVACVILITILLMPLLINKNPNIISNSTEKSLKIEQVQRTTASTFIFGEKRFVIKNYNGSVAVFDENSSSPLMVTEYKVEDLPEEAIQKINQGIVVTGQEELYKVLEDFSE